MPSSGEYNLRDSNVTNRIEMPADMWQMRLRDLTFFHFMKLFLRRPRLLTKPIFFLCFKCAPIALAA